MNTDKNLRKKKRKGKQEFKLATFSFTFPDQSFDNPIK